jgi:hypothetical protein
LGLSPQKTGAILITKLILIGLESDGFLAHSLRELALATKITLFSLAARNIAGAFRTTTATQLSRS